MTNYERIKNMSVEKLADFLYDIETYEDFCGIRIDGQRFYDFDELIQWLESEVEG